MLSNTLEQSEIVYPLVNGQPYTTIPEDLYIPPDALEVFLDAFSGPLDLLLYLIKRQNLDILDIPIVEITRQYMAYIELIQEVRLELAGEYLVMAAMLAEIKSRLLLPRVTTSDAEEDDPRAELVRRLQEYEQIKRAAESIDQLPRQDRDVFIAAAEVPPMDVVKPLPSVELNELLFALQAVLERAKMTAHHAITREPLSIRERMTQVLDYLTQSQFADFTRFFKPEEGRLGVVVTFIAILELMKQSLIEIVQTEPFSPIHIRAVST